MGFAIWLCVLCLQASLLSHALGYPGVTQGELCAGRQTADGQFNDQKQQRTPATPERLVLFRRRRQLDRRGPTHPSHSNVPGAVSVKGYPKALIQRQLGAATKKKNNRNISRVGSYSLLCNDMSTPLQVTRAKRQAKPIAPNRDSSSRSGAYSVLGNPMNEKTEPKKAY